MCGGGGWRCLFSVDGIFRTRGLAAWRLVRADSRVVWFLFVASPGLVDMSPTNRRSNNGPPSIDWGPLCLKMPSSGLQLASTSAGAVLFLLWLATSHSDPRRGALARGGVRWTLWRLGGHIIIAGIFLTWMAPPRNQVRDSCVDGSPTYVSRPPSCRVGRLPSGVIRRQLANRGQGFVR